MTSTRALIGTIALLLACSTTACGLTDGSEETGDIVIAADLERSGAAASVGQAYERALRLKIDQVNQQGVLGGRKLRLQLTDNRSDKTLSLSNIAEFAADPDVAAIIVGTCSDCVLAAAKTINDKRVPTIALAPATEVASPAGERRYIFKLGPNAADGASALVAELVRAGIRTVGLMTTEDEYGRNGEAAMTRELTKARIERVANVQFKPTDTELAQPVSRAIAEQPAAIVVWALPGQAASAAISARQAGYGGRLYFDSTAAGDLFLTGPAAAATDGAVLIATQTMAIDDVIAVTPAKAARKQWFRDYTARYGSYYGYASFAADAIQLIVDAITTVGGTSRDRVRDALETAQLDGLSGPIRLTPDNHSGLMPQALTVLVARSGRWRLAG